VDGGPVAGTEHLSHDLVYLASRAGACTTGTILGVDGGITDYAR
jgi:hypothetical protein